MEILPEEIITQILLYCSYIDILHFSRTCRSYHKSVASSSALQLHIELESNGFELSTEASRLGVEGAAARLLDEFKRYRDGWLYLKLGKPLSLGLMDVDAGMRLYELKQGYYAAAISLGSDPSNVIKLINLGNGSTHELRLDPYFNEFQIDPSQGLVVLVAVMGTSSMIHLRSFYTGNKHDEAQYPDLKIEFPSPTFSYSTSIFIEVLDDILAVKYFFYGQETAEILIWNWKLGTLLNRIQIFGGSCTFGFLTSNSLILFYSNRSSDVSAVKLLIYDKLRSLAGLNPDEAGFCDVSKYEPMVPRFQLDFPAFRSGSITHLLMRVEPAPTVPASDSAAFVPLPIARVIQLSMNVSQGDMWNHDPEHYSIFVSKEKLLKCLASLGHSSESDESPKEIPWEAWGEYATRWFGACADIPAWIRRAYGTRFICTSPFGSKDRFNSPEHLSILDFHQPTVRRFSSPHLSMWDSREARRHIDLSTSDEDMEHIFRALRNKQSAIEEDAVFVDTIDEDVPSLTLFNGETLVTRLPYRIVTKVQPISKFLGWMIDNNHIIEMPSNHHRIEDANVYTLKA